MIIDFDDETHTYIVNGDIASISVTSLLQKHKLAPNYSGVDKDVLAKASQRGKDAHKDLECVLNLANYIPKTYQGKLFSEWVENNLQCGVAEQLLALDYNGMIIAGTCDVMAFLKNNKMIIIDHKNMKQIHKETVTWQTNLYDYFARKLSGQKINGKLFNWKGADELYCFQFCNNEMNIIPLEKISDSEIEKLLEYEYHNEIYQRQELVLDDELKVAINKAELDLIAIQEQEKIAKLKCDELRQKILEVMEQQCIKSWENENLKLTYVAPVDRLSVDSTKLKKEYPDIYTKVQKLTKVKATLRVTKKGDDDND